MNSFFALSAFFAFFAFFAMTLASVGSDFFRLDLSARAQRAKRADSTGA